MASPIPTAREQQCRNNTCARMVLSKDTTRASIRHRGVAALSNYAPEADR